MSRIDKYILINKCLLSALILICFIVVGWSCTSSTSDRATSTSAYSDLDQILERGTIKVVTSYSPISYFIYHGQPLGYEYELLQHFSEELGIEVELSVERDFDVMIDKLNSGEVDMIAYSLTITGERREQVAFSHPLNITRQVLVQRKPDNWRQIPIHRTEAALVRNPIDLAGEEVHVRRASSYLERIKNLETEIGESIDIVETSAGITTEELIRAVAEREIDFTVSDENIARLNQAYYPILDVETPVSLPQQTAWAVRQESVELLEAVNSWLKDFQRETDYYVIYNKYFENRTAFRNRASSRLMFSASGRISVFDPIIQRYAEQAGIDWKLVASIIFRESQFDPDAQAWTGAYGLMQLMPATARAHGANDVTDPDENIKAGVAFLTWLNDYWEQHIEDEEERIKFVLASYNVGHGHVQDARRLAEEFGADPNLWHDNTAVYLEKKSQQKYYTHEVVRYGYARGSEPVNYVDGVLYIYNHYKAVGALRQLMQDEHPLAID